jgi:hypothetical protein
MIKINRKDGVEYMDLDTFSRWMCLIEAFHFIEQHAEEFAIDASNLLNSSAIDKYIEERYHAMRHDVGFEHAMGSI